MKKINFENDVTKVNAETFNTFQNNIDEAVVPGGGTTGQVLTKSSNEDNEVTWTDPIETTVVNNLNSGSTTSALSANQGRALNNKITLLKEEIENKHTYSTEEQVIGTWIDGKPIYRKVVSIGSLPSNKSITVNHNISNIKNIVNSSLNWFDTIDNAWLHNSRWDSPTVRISYNINSTQIWIDGAGSNWGERTKDAYATIEYTKTTD